MRSLCALQRIEKLTRFGQRQLDFTKPADKGALSSESDFALANMALNDLPFCLAVPHPSTIAGFSSPLYEPRARSVCKAAAGRGAPFHRADA